MRFLDGVTVDVNKLADELAKLAGPIAKHGWEVYVRQQYVIGAQELAWGLFFALMVAFALAWVRWGLNQKAAKEATDKAYDFWGRKGESESFAVVLGSIASVTCAITSIALCSAAAGHFINPEYGAIQGILGR